MPNLMDNTPYNSVPNQDQNVMQMIQQIRQNPKAFEEQLKRTNPQAYEQVVKIKNSANPQALILEMARQRGLNSNVLRALGLM